MSDFMTGKVKWFNAARGYGFIVNELGQDVLVHHRSIMMEGYRQLQDCQRVRFKQVKTDKGFAAAEVEVLEMA